MSTTGSGDELQLTRDDLRKSGLLEQYVLGLTSREQNRLIEEYLEKNPASREDLAVLRNQLSEYAEQYELEPPKDGRKPRTPAEFAALDHEMIMEMLARNHQLAVWRYVLGFVCLLLLASSAYLYRQNSLNKEALLVEKARHAQDDNSHMLKVKRLEDSVVEWSKLQTVSTPVGSGTLQLHHRPGAEQMILDLSHLVPPAPNEDKHYHFYVEVNGHWKEVLRVDPSDQHYLFPVKIKGNRIALYLGKRPESTEKEGLLAEIALR